MTFVLTAHQPVYLPWLGLFHKIALSDHFVWFDDVQYQTKDWNNRNKVKTPNGPSWLSVPVQRKNHFEIKVRDILIDNSKPWARKHLKTIEQSYLKAPYFSRYIDDIREIYGKQWERLSDLNWAILKYLLGQFGIDVPITTLTGLARDEVKSDLVLAMCKAHKADVYIFGAQGEDYADVEAFRRAGVEPVFQHYQHPTYPQLYGGFEPYMCALDLLFNCGPDSFDILMSGNIGRDEIRPGGDAA